MMQKPQPGALLCKSSVTSTRDLCDCTVLHGKLSGISYSRTEDCKLDDDDDDDNVSN